MKANTRKRMIRGAAAGAGAGATVNARALKGGGVYQAAGAVMGAGVGAAYGAGAGAAYSAIANRRNAKTGVRSSSPNPVKAQGRVRRKA